MTRKVGKISQDAPTKARPVDASGHILDEWGLPINGPARMAVLTELGHDDPNDNPDAWPDAWPEARDGSLPSAGTEPALEAGADAVTMESDNG